MDELIQEVIIAYTHPMNELVKQKLAFSIGSTFYRKK